MCQRICGQDGDPWVESCALPGGWMSGLKSLDMGKKGLVSMNEWGL